MFILNGDPDPTPNSTDEIFLTVPSSPAVPHASYVASVVISTHNTATGVAPGANLFSSASSFRSENPVLDTGELTAQFIAQQDSGNVRAINISFIIPYDAGGIPNGNSKFTQFIDWSASKHDVLYVVAGREGNLSTSTGQPTDNFNGMTVAFSSKHNGVGKFRQVDSVNDFSGDASGPRTSVDILAPGRNIQVQTLGGAGLAAVSGTSYAAPHVTGTVAILQEFAETRIGEADEWNREFNEKPTAYRHEVMKAVIMNSADKIEDTTNYGKYLGMERTVLKRNDDTWFQSEAYLELETALFDTPLDEEMGTGHLNAKRALQQFVPGEYELNGNYGDATVGEVPHIGWDFGTIQGTNYPINKYKIEGTLQAGNFFSATLAWDRVVEFANDANMNEDFDNNDTFQDYTDLSDVLRDLDLYLVPAGTTDVGEADILVSQSSVTSVEHIFGEIPETGEYELWVFRNNQFAPTQNYGLAWWYGLAPEIEPPDDLTGDFNDDGFINGKDFLAWQRGDSPIPYSSTDLVDWQGAYNGGAISSATAVPEPSALLLLLTAMMFVRSTRFISVH